MMMMRVCSLLKKLNMYFCKYIVKIANDMYMRLLDTMLLNIILTFKDNYKLLFSFFLHSPILQIKLGQIRSN